MTNVEAILRILARNAAVTQDAADLALLSWNDLRGSAVAKIGMCPEPNVEPSPVDRGVFLVWNDYAHPPMRLYVGPDPRARHSRQFFLDRVEGSVFRTVYWKWGKPLLKSVLCRLQRFKRDTVNAFIDHYELGPEVALAERLIGKHFPGATVARSISMDPFGVGAQLVLHFKTNCTEWEATYRCCCLFDEFGEEQDEWQRLIAFDPD